MFGDNDPGPAPYVPAGALERPAGAVVNASGEVTCVVCNSRVPLASADVVGMGYRCAACSHRAELARLTGGGDAASHFTRSERTEVARSGLILVFAGVGAVFLGVLLMAFLFFRAGIILIVGGISMAGTGLSRHNAAH